MRSSIRRVVALLAASIGLCATSNAFAQTSSAPPSSRGALAVLGFGATPTEDEAARTITDVLEQSARRAGFTLTQSLPSLEQALAVAGCEEVFVDDCMPRIAENLHLARVIYGRAVRRGESVRFELSFYDATSHATRHTGIEVPRALAVDSDTLGRRVRRALDELIPLQPPAPPPSPAPRVTSSAPPSHR